MTQRQTLILFIVGVLLSRDLCPGDFCPPIISIVIGDHATGANVNHR